MISLDSYMVLHATNCISRSQLEKPSKELVSLLKWISFEIASTSPREANLDLKWNPWLTRWHVQPEFGSQNTVCFFVNSIALQTCRRNSFEVLSVRELWVNCNVTSRLPRSGILWTCPCEFRKSIPSSAPDGLLMSPWPCAFGVATGMWLGERKDSQLETINSGVWTPLESKITWKDFDDMSRNEAFYHLNSWYYGGRDGLATLWLQEFPSRPSFWTHKDPQWPIHPGSSIGNRKHPLNDVPFEEITLGHLIKLMPLFCGTLFGTDCNWSFGCGLD